MTSIGREADRLLLRLPNGMRDELKALAVRRRRSTNGQVVAMLESGLAAEKTASERTA